ncbi:MAG: hypothetical protein H6733_00340 [Alphaproteobacteria bacterium]|nr:hypothetical protein [Alphaproteobacteria bacterium]
MRGLRSVLVPWLALAACGAPTDTDPDDTDTDTTDSDTDTVAETDTVDTTHTDVVDSDTDTTVDTDGASGPPDDLFRSGSRLRVQVWSVGGAYAFAGLVDTLLDVPCTPQTATDGALRCVPRAGDIDAVFADASCTSPLFYLPEDACVASPYLQLSGGGQARCGFPASHETFALRSVTTPATVYADRPTCHPTTAPAGGVFDVDPLGDTPVDPADLVAFTVQDRPEASGVGIRWLVGDDGTWLAWGHATASGACSPLEVDGATRCVGTSRAERSVDAPTFGDAACSDPKLAFVRLDPGCTAADVIVQTGASAATRLFQPGPVWTGGVWGRAGTCRAVSGSDTWIQVGDEVDTSTLPTLAPQAVGSGDLRVLRWEDADGVRLALDDTARFELADGTPCAPVAGADGAFACLPADALEIAGGVVWYGDAACTLPVAMVGQSTADVGWVRAQDGCAGPADEVVGEVWTFGADYEGTLYQLGGTCVGSLPTFPSQRWRFATASALTAAYPALTLTTLPAP